jgi:hypothetical protein
MTPVLRDLLAYSWDDGIERERMRCGDWRTEREMRGKRREDGRGKREEKNERQQTLDSRAC